MLLAVGLMQTVAVAAQAAATAGPIFRCETPAGVIEYSNAAPGGDAARRCQQVELPTITTIPAPAPRSPATNGRIGDSKPASSFPQISTATQKSRDNDRSRILHDELRREQDRLSSLRGQFNDGQPERHGDERNYQKYLDRVEQMRTDIARHESNVDALRREIEDLSN